MWICEHDVNLCEGMFYYEDLICKTLEMMDKCERKHKRNDGELTW